MYFTATKKSFTEQSIFFSLRLQCIKSITDVYFQFIVIQRGCTCKEHNEYCVFTDWGILYIFYSADTEKLWNLYRNFYISLLIKFNTIFFLGGGGYIKFKIENTCTYLTEVFVIRIHIKFMMVRGGGGVMYL